MKDRIDLESKARQTLAQILGGAALLIGLYFTYQTVQTSQETLRTTQQGQLAERFTKAIDQLGRDNLAMRLGGIYALEQIAEDSIQYVQYHWPVMEVLTAYVRERASVQERPSNNTAQGGIEQISPKTQGCMRKDLPTLFGFHGQLPADIQAILTVLSRRTGSYGNREVYRLDLRNTQLPKARLDNTQLQGAILIGAHLQDAYLLGAHLQQAILIGAQLQGAELGSAQLYGANLTEASLQDACLIRAELQWAYLIKTHLERADLREADLLGANLSEANLLGARLWRANLLGANLQRANLQRANLLEANLTQDQVNVACLDENTALPADLTKPPPCPAHP